MTNNQVCEATSETTANAKPLVEIDQSYQRLRAAVGEAFTAALESGKVLVQQNKRMTHEDNAINVETLAYNVWLNAITDPVTKQHYTCRQCFSNWTFLFNAAVIEEDGSLTYPALQAFLSLQDDPVVKTVFDNAPEGFIDYLQGIPKDRERQIYPVTAIPLHLAYGADSSGWDHYFAASKEVVEGYNDRFTYFNDFSYIDYLSGKLLDPKYDLEVMQALFVAVGNKLDAQEQYTDHRSALRNYPQLLDFAKTARLVQKVSNAGTAYIWSLLANKQNSFLRHVGSSVLGIVIKGFERMQLEGGNVTETLNYVVGILGVATDTENYKVKTAEAKPATVDQAYSLLKEKNIEYALTRRLLLVDEVPTTIWSPSVLTVPEEDTPVVSVLDKAYNDVMALKDTPVQRREDTLATLSNSVGTKNYSLVTFLDLLGSIAQVDLLTGNYFPCFVTTAVVDADYSSVFNFSNTPCKNTTTLTSARPLAWATLESVITDPNKRGNRIPVEAIFKASNGLDNNAITVLQVSEVAAKFAQQSSVGNGSCVTGSIVRSEHYGLSGALVELSKKHTLAEVNDTEKVAGGIVLTIGVKLMAIYQDGRKEIITITSEK